MGLGRLAKAYLAPAGLAIGLLFVPGTTGTAGAAPIFGQTPRTQFFNGTALRSFGLFQKSEGGEKDLEVWSAPVVASYAFQPDLTATLTVPYVNKRLETPTRTFTADGVGDAQLIGKYRFFRKDSPFGRLQASFLGGLKLPTGSNSKGPGIKAMPPLQLGSGSLDVILGGAAGRTTMNWSVEGALTYQINTEADDFRFGNVLAYDLYIARQTYPNWPTPGLSQLNFSVELNGRTTDENEVDNRSVRSTGGTALFISPGIQYILSGNLLVEAGVQIPIVRDLDRGQLKPDYSVLFGFRYLF